MKNQPDQLREIIERTNHAQKIIDRRMSDFLALQYEGVKTVDVKQVKNNEPISQLPINS